MSSTAKHATITSTKWMNMSWPSQIRRFCFRICQRTDCHCSVIHGNTCGTTTSNQIDRNGERRFVQRRIICNLHLQFQFRTSVFANRCAKFSTTVTNHKIYFFGSDFFRRNYEIALIFTVFVVNHNHKISFLEFLQRLFYRIKSILNFVLFFHRQLNIYGKGTI